MLEPVAEFFRMGGYAFYVWGSYAVVFVVLALNLAAPSLRLRRVRRTLARQARFAEDPEAGDDEPPGADDPSGSPAVPEVTSRTAAAAIRYHDPQR